MPSNKLIPLADAALKTQSTTLNLLMHIKRGLLPATEEQGQWFISAGDLDQFIADKGKVDPAEVCVQHRCAKVCGSCAEQ